MGMVEYKSVPSYPRYVAGSDGSLIGPSGKTLAGSLDGDGYRQVLVYRKGMSRVCRKVHVLVCEAYHGLRPSPKHQVAHANGDKSDNRPENLRWVTARENIADKIKHGTVTRTVGQINGQAKLTEKQVSEIRSRWWCQGVTQRQLAEEYGVKQPTISNIISRRTWGHC